MEIKYVYNLTCVHCDGALLRKRETRPLPEDTPLLKNTVLVYILFIYVVVITTKHTSASHQ